MSCNRSIAFSVSRFDAASIACVRSARLRVAVPRLRLRVGRTLRHRQELVQPALAVGQRIERRQRLPTPSGSNASWSGRRPELLPNAIVVVEQGAVVENQVLPDDALERPRLLEELAARASRLGRLLHRLATLRLQLIEREDELAQRVEQRQAHQQEAEQDELEEGTGVIHGRRRPIICGNYDTPPVGAYAGGPKYGSEKRWSPQVRRPRVALIAAVAANGVIGADNRLPWRLPEDLKRFRALTVRPRGDHGTRRRGNPLPRALPERQNIVVTRRGDFAAAGAEIAASISRARARPGTVAGARVLHRRRRGSIAPRCPSRPRSTSTPRSRATSTATRGFLRSRAATGARSRARSTWRRLRGRIRLRVRHVRACDTRGMRDPRTVDARDAAPLAREIAQGRAMPPTASTAARPRAARHQPPRTRRHAGRAPAGRRTFRCRLVARPAALRRRWRAEPRQVVVHRRSRQQLPMRIARQPRDHRAGPRQLEPRGRARKRSRRPARPDDASRRRLRPCRASDREHRASRRAPRAARARPCRRIPRPPRRPGRGPPHRAGDGTARRQSLDARSEVADGRGHVLAEPPRAQEPCRAAFELTAHADQHRRGQRIVDAASSSASIAFHSATKPKTSRLSRYRRGRPRASARRWIPAAGARTCCPHDSACCS